MFLSKLFSNARAKVMMAFASLTMVLGVGASFIAAQVSATSHAVETKATEVTASYALTGSGTFLGGSTEWGAGVTMYRDTSGSDLAYKKGINLAEGDIFKIRPTGSGDWYGWRNDLPSSLFEQTAASSSTNGIECTLSLGGGITWWANDAAATRITVKKGGEVIGRTYSRINTAGAAYPNFYLNLSWFQSGCTLVLDRIPKGGGDDTGEWNSSNVAMPTDKTKKYYFTINSDSNNGTSFTSSTEDNIRVKANGYYDIYLNGSRQVWAEHARFNVTLNKQSGTGGSDSVTAIYGEGMPSIIAPSRSHYEFKGYFGATGGKGTKYYNADGTSAHSCDLTGATTLYAYWADQVTMTYKHYDIFGVSHGDDLVTYHNKSSAITLDNGVLSGYKFEGWYTNYNSTTHVFSGTRYDGGGSYPMGTTNATLYGRYVPVGAYLAGLGSDWEMADAVVGTDAGIGTDGNAMIGFRGVTISAGDEFKIYQFSTSSSVPYGDDYAVFGTDGVSRFNIVHGSGDNNIVCKPRCGGTYDIFFDSVSHYIYIYSASIVTTDGYYLTGTNEFSKSFGYDLRPDKLMTSGLGGNVAALETEDGTLVSPGTYVQPVHYYYPRAIWYNVTLGSPAPTGWSVDDNKAYYNGASSGRFNFYVKTVAGGSSSGAEAQAGTCLLYIVDVSAVGERGYLYIASSKTAGSIGVTTKLNDDTVVVNNKKLDEFSSTHTVSTIAFFDNENYAYIHRVPILNLRGSNVSAEVTKVVFNDGIEKTITGLPTAATDSPHYYAVFGAGISAVATADNGKAARAVFELCEMLEENGGTSICDMDDSDLGTLKGLIEAGYSGSSTLMNAAKVTTFPSKTRTGTDEWLVSDVYKQICIELEEDSDIGEWPLASAFFPGARREESSPLTTTLWIVLASGLAGLAAIGTAYFVSKKKRHQA